MPAAPTQDLLEEFEQLTQQRREADAAARTFAKRLDAIKEDLMTWLGDRRSAKRHGFQVSLVDGRRHVKWKDILIGEIGAARVNDIEQDAPFTQSLKVERLK